MSRQSVLNCRFRVPTAGAPEYWALIGSARRARSPPTRQSGGSCNESSGSSSDRKFGGKGIMRVLHVIHSLDASGGGPPMGLAALARAQAASGMHVTVLPCRVSADRETLSPGQYGRL